MSALEKADIYVFYGALRSGTTLAYQWKRKQTAQEVSEVEHKLGELMALTGYAPSEDGPKPPTSARRRQLLVQSKLAVWRERFRRYGVVDPLVVAVTRRLGLGGLGRKAQLRMDQVTNRLVK